MPASTVLVVDDDPAIRVVFSTALSRAGYRTLEAASGADALALLEHTHVDVALVDVEMPGVSGIEFANQVRARSETETMGIVFVSGHGALDSKLAGLDAGATDYLVKPVVLEELLARVAAQLRDRNRWLGLLDRQLATRSALARQIAELDPAIPMEVLERELLRILSTELPLSALSVTAPADIDADPDDLWSVVSGSHGVHVRIPLRFAGRLVGGLDATIDGPAERAVSALGDLAPQLGAVVAEGTGSSNRMQDVRGWVETLLADGGLSAVYQPVVTLGDRTVIGYEGLSRFADGTAPDVGFARAGKAGVGPRLEIAAIERLLSSAGSLAEGTWLSVNVSVETLLSGIDPTVLARANRPVVLELTETEHVADYTALRDRLAELPDIRLAVDDAGAGYASLRHVFELRPHLVKLDRGWVTDIHSDPVRQALIRGLMGFSAAFDASIIAEGVERIEQATTLQGLDVPLAQGFLFGRPTPDGAPEAA